MPRNIEIKARIRDPESVRRRAEALAGKPPRRMYQHDVFFATPRGRLKLRRLDEDGEGELIHYERPDATGPKASRYAIHHTRDAASLHDVLNDALGARGQVVKTRLLFLVGRTRIHLDTVEGLGHFLELEVVLEEGDDEQAGVAEASHLMRQLGIEASDLVKGAYIDLLEAEAEDRVG